MNTARRWSALAAVALAAAVTAAPALWNGFAYDDLQFVAGNPAVTGASRFSQLMQQPYWAGGLFRPLTIWLMAQQWHLGHGSPWVFHATSLLLAVAVSCMVLALAQRLLPATPALIGAVLFAVHPVHAEAVANVVGQAELLAALLVMLGVLIALPDFLSWPQRPRVLAVALLAALAPLAKEQGFMLPALLGTVLLLRPSPHALRSRLAAASPMLLAAAAGAFPILLWRTYVLRGLGQEPLAVLASASPGQRILIFLELVPEWLRLLIWPVRLQAEYSPPQLGQAIFGTQHLWGIAGLTFTIWLAWAARRGAAVVTLGITWMAMAIFPVSNLIFLTGILLAERTMLLPSVGACLAVTALGAVAAQRLSRPTRVAGWALVLSVILAAAWHSARRGTIWRDNDRLFAHGILDAPHSYRSWKVYGGYLAQQGKLTEAEGMLRTSLQLWDRDAEVYEQLTRVLRRKGKCDAAISILDDGLKSFPEETVLRARLVECLIQQDRLADARGAAAAGKALGDPAATQMMQRVEAASNGQERGHQ